MPCSTVADAGRDFALKDCAEGGNRYLVDNSTQNPPSFFSENLKKTTTTIGEKDARNN